jgi:hypothetical protein
MTVMHSPTIHYLRAKREARGSASASTAACHCLADLEPAVAARYPDATSVLSSNADRWTVLPASKLGRLAARSHLANVDAGEPKLPANTYNLNEAARAADARARVDVGHRLTFDFHLWLARLNRNPHAHPGCRDREGPGHVQVLW